ncbi:MAG TPA: HD domain-containing phosphohydrolase [Dermatophilaceae bacterium]|nr:HD domain-containing phosphohydrolase [Dermatophilaceae bacterium]
MTGLRIRVWTSTVVAVGAAVLVWATISAGPTLGQSVGNSGRLLGCFVLAIGVGELARVHMPTGRVTAPVATASAVTLAMIGRIDGEPTFGGSADLIVLTVAAGMAGAAAIRAATGREVALHLMAARLIGVSLVAVLARSVGGAFTPWELALYSLPRWLVAGVMVATAALGILLELVLTGLMRAERDGTYWRTALQDELGEAVPLTLGLVTAGPLVALLAPVMGLSALPLALVPMVLTYLAVRRYAANRMTYRETIITLSRLTEESGYTPTHHAQRVAELAVRLARSLGLSEREVRDVEYAALLHDLGQLGLRHPIPGGATVLAAPVDQRHIAAEGARIVRHTAVLDTVAGYVEKQATAYRRVRELGETVPLASRIIKVANAHDDLTGGSADPAVRAAALERIHLGLGYEYDPAVVDALVEVTGGAGWASFMVGEAGTAPDPVLDPSRRHGGAGGAPGPGAPGDRRRSRRTVPPRSPANG